jgi:glycerol-3-phosphate dehydrogenase
MFNKQGREENLRKIESQEYDLLVVGGGITGAGVARDAASRGLRVLLVEAGDFASGTSSRSSKLVHGGIRYLENLEFRLVHEALTERRTLLEIAPHLVHPLRFMIPIYKKSRVGLMKMEAGMILYDVLSAFEAPKLHELKMRKATMRREPLLRSDELTGSVTYSDAFMEDDRLVVETLRSAREFGATCLSYVKATKVHEQKDICLVDLKDVEGQKTYQIRARQVMGCLGPWTDIFGQQALDRWKNVLRPTKGVHLVFDRRRIPVSQAIVMAVEERIVFVIPRDNVVIVGTTDTDFQNDPSDVNTDSADVTYLLGVTNKYFPTLMLQKSDIMSCYSGVRPLVKSSAESESKTSREHEIFDHSPRVTLVAGGKYTTYRAMAEEIVERVLAKLPFEERMSLRAPRTKQALNARVTAEKIDRLLVQSVSLAKDFQVSPEIVRYLARRRGEDALPVLQTMEKTGDALENMWNAEARFCLNHEMCFNLVDFYWRRSPLFLFHADHGARYLRSLASVFSARLGWSETQKQEQIARLEAQIAHETRSLR